MMDVIKLTNHAEAVWKTYFEEIESAECDDTLLQIFDASFRLRRIPETVTALINVLANEFQVLKGRKISWPEKVTERFAIHCQELPPNQTVSLWKTFSEGINAKLIPQIADNKDSSYLLKIIVDLFTKLIMNTKFLEHNIPHLQSVLEQVPKLCISPLLRLHLDKPKDTVLVTATLSLAYVWGEAVMMLQQYCDKNLLNVQDSKLSASDLSVIHFYFDDWKTIKSHVIASSSRDGLFNEPQYIYSMLILQEMRAIHQFSNRLGINAKVSIVKRTPLLLKLAQKSIKQKTINPRQNAWLAVLSHLHLFEPELTCDSLVNIVDTLIDVQCREDNNDLKDAMRRIMTGNQFMELKSFETTYVSVILEKISKMSGLSESSLHVQIFEALSSDNNFWILDQNTTPKSENGVVWQKITEVGSKVDEVLSAPIACNLDPSQLMKYLEALDLISLDELYPANQTRCLYGIFGILSTLDVTQINSEQLRVNLLCQKLISRILKGTRSVWAFDFISHGSFLKWYTEFQFNLVTVSCDVDPRARLMSYEASFFTFVSRTMNNFTRRNELKTFIDYLQLLGEKSNLKQMSEYKMELYFTTLKLTIKHFKKLLAIENPKRAKEGVRRLYLDNLSAVVVSCAGRVLVKESSAQMLNSMMELFALTIKVDSMTKAHVNLSQQLAKKVNKVFQTALKTFLVETTESSLKVYADLFSYNFAMVTTYAPDLIESIWNRTKELHEQEWDREEHGNLLGIIENLAENIFKFSAEQDFKAIVFKLLSSTMVNNVTKGNLSSINSSLRLWQLMPCKLAPELKHHKQKACERLLVFLPHLVNKLDKEDPKFVSLLVAVMTLIEKLLKTKQVRFEDMPFHLFTEVNFEVPQLDIKLFAELYEKFYLVLDYVFMNCSREISKSVPLLYSCVSVLMHAILHRSDQSMIQSVEVELPLLKDCALNLTRLFQRFQKKQEDFNRIAPYLVSDFVSKVQQKTILPAVKEILSAAIYEIIDICDEYSIALLKSNLTPTSREFFNELNNNFLKYHRYKGKV